MDSVDMQQTLPRHRVNHSWYSEALNTLHSPSTMSAKWRDILVAVGLYVFALGALLLFQQFIGINSFALSHYPHWTYQAYALLHGHWYLDPYYPSHVDTALINGHYYLYYPPFPAVLMLPMVALFGTAASDTLFNTLVSASILPLMFLLFEQIRANGLTRRAWQENLLWSTFLYFGSIILFLSGGGRLWFVTHIVLIATGTLSLLLAFRRHYTWATVAMGCAFFTRFTVLPGFLFLLYLAWEDGAGQGLIPAFVRSLLARRPDWSGVPWRRILPVVAVALAVGIVLLVRDTLEFGSPLNNGYTTMMGQDYPELTTLYSIQFVPGNFVAFFLAFPQAVFAGGRFDHHPYFDMLNGQIGISIFATTPLFLLIFWRNRQFSAVRTALWITILIIVVSLLPYAHPGAYQFGIRYLTDMYPFAFLLLVLTDVRLDWRVLVLGLLGIAINFLGAAQWWSGFILHV